MRCATSRWLVLQNAQQFGAVMQQGQVVARSKHFVLHALRWHPMAATPGAEASSQQQQRIRSTAIFPAKHPAQAYSGAIVPKRWARRAVTRNLVQRQVRHAMRAHIPALPGGLAVVVRQRAAFDPQQFVSASSSMLRTAVRQELIELASKADWQAIACLAAPPCATAATDSA